jgi:predicted transcriptional regulator
LGSFSALCRFVAAEPDDATWQDLLYALELRGDVEAGLADAKAGRVTDSEDLRNDRIGLFTEFLPPASKY